MGVYRVKLTKKIHDSDTMTYGCYDKDVQESRLENRNITCEPKI